MTVIAIYPKKYTTLRPGELRRYILRKRICVQECPYSEIKVLSPDFKEGEDAESFESDSQVCLRAIF